MMRKWRVFLAFVLGGVVGVGADRVWQHRDAVSALLESRVAQTADSTADTEWHDKVEVLDVMRIDTLKKAVVYYPRFSRIDLMCGQQPSDGDERIVLAVEAAATGEVLEAQAFNHRMIAGDHVSGGVFYQGFSDANNTGMFAWFKDKWHFASGTDKMLLVEASDHQGAGFLQQLFIHKGERVHCSISGTHQYHVLAQYKGRLCIIESKGATDFFSFVMYLLEIGVQEAMYLAQGKGFVHTNVGTSIRLQPQGESYDTNWLVFYKKEPAE